MRSTPVTLGNLHGPEGLKHRPDFQQSVDAFWRDGQRLAHGITHTFPIQHSTSGDGLGHREGQRVLVGTLPHLPMS